MTLHQSLKSKCLVIGDQSSTFSMVSTSLTECGVVEIDRSSDFVQALEKLEVETYSWVLCPTGINEPVNIFQFLTVILREPLLRNTYVSLFYQEDELAVATSAFEHGLLSCFQTFTTQAEFDEQLRLFWRKEASCRGDVVAIAAASLAELLLRQGRKKDHVTLRQNLVEHFPGNMEFLLNLAESRALMGDLIPAASTLMQVKLIAPNLASQVEEIRSEYLPHMHLDITQGASMTNVLGINKAVIVDPDVAVVNSILEILESLGAKGVEAFHSPEDALSFLKGRPDQDLIIHEWKMPRITGPVFIQKVRQMGLERTPVILCSSQVSDRDQHLTREMGIAAVIPKPFKRGVLLESVIWTMKQEHRPTEIRIVERKIQGFLSRGNPHRGRELLNRLKSEKKLPESCFGYFEAEILFAQNKLEESKAQALDSLRRGFTSVRLFHLVGKILMKLGDFEAAIKFLEKAQELSPHHVMRLCMLADAQSELGKTQPSRKTLDVAASLDSRNEAVIHSEVTLSLASGDTKKASKILQSLDCFDEVVSYLNSRAVALSRGGRSQESIGCYQQAIASLPSQAEGFLASLHYNLSLAQIRGRDFEGALKALKVADKFKDQKIGKKIASLLSRLQKAVDKGETFELKGSEPSVDPVQEKKGATSEGAKVIQLVGEAEVGPGDYGLYKLFIDQTYPEKVEFLKKVPRFHFRGISLREATLGAVKSSKSR